MKYLFAIVTACYGLFVAAAPLDGPAPFTDHDVTCLAKVIYFEERGESAAEQKAVAEVVLNRVERGFAGSVCEVVHQRGQFPWATHMPRVREPQPYARARELAFRLLAGFEPRTDHTSLYFNAGWRPAWAHRKVFAIKRIGKNLFLW
jgi:spore germination cell wall hydrolase CwlJ-like protein